MEVARKPFQIAMAFSCCRKNGALGWAIAIQHSSDTMGLHRTLLQLTDHSCVSELIYEIIFLSIVSVCGNLDGVHLLLDGRGDLETPPHLLSAPREQEIEQPHVLLQHSLGDCIQRRSLSSHHIIVPQECDKVSEEILKLRGVGIGLNTSFLRASLIFCRASNAESSFVSMIVFLSSSQRIVPSELSIMFICTRNNGENILGNLLLMDIRSVCRSIIT